MRAATIAIWAVVIGALVAVWQGLAGLEKTAWPAEMGLLVGIAVAATALLVFLLVSPKRLPRLGSDWQIERTGDDHWRVRRLRRTIAWNPNWAIGSVSATSFVGNTAAPATRDRRRGETIDIHQDASAPVSIWLDWIEPSGRYYTKSVAIMFPVGESRNVQGVRYVQGESTSTRD